VGGLEPELPLSVLACHKLMQRGVRNDSPFFWISYLPLVIKIIAIYNLRLNLAAMQW
jgi:hypothetical protein